MNIHEYQAKEIFRQYGVPVPRGQVAFTVDEAVEAAKNLEETSGLSRLRSMLVDVVLAVVLNWPNLWMKYATGQMKFLV